MIGWVAPLARVLHDVPGCALLGLLVFFLVIDPYDGRPDGAGPIGGLKAAVALNGAYLLAGVAVLAVQLAIVAGTAQVLAEPAAWARYALDTRFGHTWLVQQGTALLLLVLLASRKCSATAARVDVALWTALAALAASMSAFAGHGAGGQTALATPIQTIHVLAAGTWFGGLPALFVRLWRAARDDRARAAAVAALGRFSLLAGGAMLCLAATGLATAWLQIGSIPSLLGTPYGKLLLLKLVLLAAILSIAARIRWRLLPRARLIPADQACIRRLVSLLGLELVLAVGLIAVAGLLAGAPPAIHDQVVWPFPVRFAPDVAWALPGVKEQVAAGLAVALAGAVFALTGIRGARGRRRPVLVASVLVAAGLGVASWPLTVQASRDTYRVASVPYDATSIANGERLFRQYCITCHGQSAVGDGPAAASLPHRPADLTAAHVRDHTMGDMFGWISNGIAAGGMPAFADLLSEDERWDLVNFVHTLSIGYQARVLRESIVPRGPWLAAPDFAFATTSGAGLALQDYRERQVVLLVLFTLPDSEPRLRALAQAAGALAAAGVAVITVPIESETEPGEAASAILDGRTPATGSGDEIVLSYMLFRHTLENQRIGEVEPKPRHMEFLIDRYGFVRARWLPEDEAAGWRDLAMLLTQARALTAEGWVRPPPDGHIH